MRVLVQRVLKAHVNIKGTTVSSIGHGILLFIGIEASDGEEDILWLSNKILGLRIFDDENEVMNLSLKDIDGDLLAVSQFTLHARVKKGFRPSYIDAAHPDISVPLYNQFVKQLESDLGKSIPTGKFGTQMEVSLVNEGPVTIFIDSKQRK